MSYSLLCKHFGGVRPGEIYNPKFDYGDITTTLITKWNTCCTLAY